MNINNKVPKLFTDVELLQMVNYCLKDSSQQDLNNQLKRITFSYREGEENHWSGWADWSDFNDQHISIWFGTNQKPTIDIQKTDKGKVYQVLGNKWHYGIRAIQHEITHIYHPGWNHGRIRRHAYETLRRWKKQNPQKWYLRYGGSFALAMTRLLKEKL